LPANAAWRRVVAAFEVILWPLTMRSLRRQARQKSTVDQRKHREQGSRCRILRFDAIRSGGDCGFSLTPAATVQRVLRHRFKAFTMRSSL
jgi:hypothetical protein